MLFYKGKTLKMWSKKGAHITTPAENVGEKREIINIKTPRRKLADLNLKEDPLTALHKV